jgi:hypothetical protein
MLFNDFIGRLCLNLNEGKSCHEEREKLFHKTNKMVKCTKKQDE